MNLNLSGRFGLFELIVVVTLIGVLWAAGARYYGLVMDDARRTGFEAQARAFTSVVAMIHWSWAAGGTNMQPATQSRDAMVLIDQQPLYVNRYGWPTHASENLSLQPVRAEGCRQVWDTIMQNPGNTRVKAEHTSPDGIINVSVVDARLCRYEILSPGGIHSWFDYDVISGRIDVVSGR